MVSSPSQYLQGPGMCLAWRKAEPWLIPAIPLEGLLKLLAASEDTMASWEPLDGDSRSRGAAFRWGQRKQPKTKFAFPGAGIQARRGGQAAPPFNPGRPCAGVLPMRTVCLHMIDE